ncbi:phage integrase central domain-containing protein [Mesorhizobium sp. BHbsci]
MTQYAYPVIGDYRVNAIAIPDVLRVLSPIWLTKPENAIRVRRGSVLSWIGRRRQVIAQDTIRWKGSPADCQSKRTLISTTLRCPFMRCWLCPGTPIIQLWADCEVGLRIPNSHGFPNE